MQAYKTLGEQALTNIKCSTAATLFVLAAGQYNGAHATAYAMPAAMMLASNSARSSKEEHACHKREAIGLTWNDEGTTKMAAGSVRNAVVSSVILYNLFVARRKQRRSLKIR